MPSISAFFPAYNDGGTIASMVVTMTMALDSLTDDYEVIVVNDGSHDYTGEVLAELEKRYPRLTVVTHPQNRGYGGALRTGFASATKDLVFYTDGDAQYDPRELRLLLPALKEGIDVVNGYKIDRSDPIERVVIGKIYQWVVRVLFGLKLKDPDCDFRLMRRQVFDRVKLQENSGIICVELMKKIQDAGFTVAEVPVHHYHRAYGKSQFFNLRRVFKTGVGFIRLWLSLRHRSKLEEEAYALSRKQV